MAGKLNLKILIRSDQISWETVKTSFAHSNPSPGNPVPMDIDATWKAKATPDTCRRCGKTGHWAKDCDLCFDV